MGLSSRGGIKDSRENNKHLIWACDEELRRPAADTGALRDDSKNGCVADYRAP